MAEPSGEIAGNWIRLMVDAIVTEDRTSASAPEKSFIPTSLTEPK
jgi:hypothetical protein